MEKSIYGIYGLAYIGTLVTYLILDGIWLGFVAKDSYIVAMGELMKDKFPVAPWVVFYLMYTFAIVHLVIMPHIHASKGLYSLLFSGAILGMAAYGAYNLTNYAIIRGWPVGISVIDWAWGIFVTASSGTVGWYCAKYYLGV